MAVEMTNQVFRFVNLPGEIREQVYSYIFAPSAVRTARDEDGLFSYRYDLSLFSVNRQIYYEARKIFRQLNIFVSIETPWQEVGKYVITEGLVPVIVAKEAANSFAEYTLGIEIGAHDPEREAFYPEQAARKIIILADDLEAFTRFWFYIDLNYGGHLNPNLKLTLQMRNPYAPSYDDQHIPKALQARLLEPFGLVKGLHSLEIVGQHYTSLEQKLRIAMAIPYDPPEKCLSEATQLKDEGNLALTKKQPHRAIELYVAAFEKIHIVCVGKRRKIWAEPWFDRQFTEGPFEGQYGQVIRVTLRVSLVASMIKAYLDLEQYEEAKHWGMRSIRLAREMAGLESDGEGDEPLLEFPASTQMGNIYYRTGVAFKALGETEEARKVFRVAKLYLPHDESVERELASVSPRNG